MGARLASPTGASDPRDRTCRGRLWRRGSWRLLMEGRIDAIFQSGLHEYLQDFIMRNNRLGAEISQAYHFTD